MRPGGRPYSPSDVGRLRNLPAWIETLNRSSTGNPRAHAHGTGPAASASQLRLQTVADDVLSFGNLGQSAKLLLGGLGGSSQVRIQRLLLMDLHESDSGDAGY